MHLAASSCASDYVPHASSTDIAMSVEHSLSVCICGDEAWPRCGKHAAASDSSRLRAGCADVVDIGETAYAQVLADDLDGDGRMDLLLATMGGNMYCLSTSAAYDPLASWTSQVAQVLTQAVTTSAQAVSSHGPCMQRHKPVANARVCHVCIAVRSSECLL